MSAPLVWLLLSAIAVLAPQAASGPKQWDGPAPVVVTRPSQPVEGSAVTIGVARVPARARRVLVVADDQVVPTHRVGRGLWRGQLTAPTAGPVTLRVRFTVHGTRYQTAGGVIFVVPDTSVG
jgi:hypothetical protein